MAVPSTALDGEEDDNVVGAIRPPTWDSFPTYHGVDRCDWRKAENHDRVTMHGKLKAYVGNAACRVTAKGHSETYDVNTPCWIWDGKHAWLVPVMYSRGDDKRLWLVCTTVKYANNSNQVHFNKNCTWANVWSWCNTLDELVVSAAHSFAEDWFSKQVRVRRSLVWDDEDEPLCGIEVERSQTMDANQKYLASLEMPKVGMRKNNTKNNTKGTAATTNAKAAGHNVAHTVDNDDDAVPMRSTRSTPRPQVSGPRLSSEKVCTSPSVLTNHFCRTGLHRPSTCMHPPRRLWLRGSTSRKPT